MSDYLEGNRFIFNDECPDFTLDDVMSGLGLPMGMIKSGGISRIFDDIKDEVRSLIHMSAGAVYFRIPDRTIPPVSSGTLVLGVILTLGSDITQRSDEYLAQGEYTRGLVINEISDFCLISYEKIIRERLQVLSERKGVGCLRMYESTGDIPFSELKYVSAALGMEKTLGVYVTRDSTLYPVKSSCFILRVQESGE